MVILGLSVFDNVNLVPLGWTSTLTEPPPVRLSCRTSTPICRRTSRFTKGDNSSSSFSPLSWISALLFGGPKAKDEAARARVGSPHWRAVDKGESHVYYVHLALVLSFVLSRGVLEKFVDSELRHGVHDESTSKDRLMLYSIQTELSVSGASIPTIIPHV